MAWTIDQAFVHAFDATMQHLSSEGAENIRSTVRNRPGVRGKTFNIERISGVEPIEITSRHQTTQLTPFPHSRRRLTVGDWGLSEMIDDIDKVKMLISPESDYTQEFARSFNRKVAQTIVNAMGGNAIAVGADDAQTNVALPSGQAIAHGSAGFTMAKVRQASRIMDVNGVPVSGRHWLVTPFAIEDLLADTTVTSSDFSTLRALQQGTIPEGATWYGFQWHKVTDALGGGNVLASPILPKTGNIRSTFAYHMNAVTLAVPRDFTIESAPDPGYWNNQRVMVKFVLGAVRVEDEAVVKVDFDESL